MADSDRAKRNIANDGSPQRPRRLESGESSNRSYAVRMRAQQSASVSPRRTRAPSAGRPPASSGTPRAKSGTQNLGARAGSGGASPAKSETTNRGKSPGAAGGSAAGAKKIVQNIAKNDEVKHVLKAAVQNVDLKHPGDALVAMTTRASQVAMEITHDHAEKMIKPPNPPISLSIFSCMFCCPLLGLIPVRRAFRAKHLVKEGHRAHAHLQSKIALIWSGITIFVGVCLWILVLYDLLLRERFNHFLAPHAVDSAPTSTVTTQKEHIMSPWEENVIASTEEGHTVKPKGNKLKKLATVVKEKIVKPKGKGSIDPPGKEVVQQQ